MRLTGIRPIEEIRFDLQKKVTCDVWALNARVFLRATLIVETGSSVQFVEVKYGLHFTERSGVRDETVA